MNRQADRDSGNRRLDVVGIGNPNKAVGEWKRQMFLSTMHIMYCKGCRLRPISNRPMSGFVAGQGGKTDLSPVFQAWGSSKRDTCWLVGAALRRLGKKGTGNSDARS